MTSISAPHETPGRVGERAIVGNGRVGHPTGAPGWNWHVSRVSSVNSFLHCWRVHMGIVVVEGQVRNSGIFHTFRRSRFLTTARLISHKSTQKVLNTYENYPRNISFNCTIWTHFDRLRTSQG